MGTLSRIAWTDHTWNPWRGCSHAELPDGSPHAGCANCYAEAMSRRNPKVLGTWGKHGRRDPPLQTRCACLTRPPPWGSMNGHNQPGLGGRQPLPIPHTAGPRPAARFFGEPEAVPLRISRQLREVSPFMADADLAAFRGAGAIARLISIGARGPYTHVGLIARSWGQVLLLEMRELAGGRIVTLRSQVEKYPGQIDWFRLDRGRFPEFDPAAAIARMVQFSGQPYGYWELARMAAAHIPFLRLGVLGQPYRPGRPLVCSTAVDLACSEGGLVDPVPQRPNQTTEPQDLTESHLWKYSCTLTPSSPSLPAW